MTFCTAHMYGYSPQCEWAYETWVLRFPAWLDHFLHSVHLCGFSPLWVSMWRIMWLRNSCTRWICLDSLQCVFWCYISWATVQMGHRNWEKNIFGSEMGWYIGNNRACPVNCLMRFDDKFYIVYIGQQGLWAQGFGKTEQKWQFMGKTLPQTKRQKSSLHVTSLHFFSLLCLF